MLNPLEDINVEEFRQLTDRAAARTVKREYVKKGFEYQLSFYGIVVDKATNKNEYRRIEILSNERYTQEMFFDLSAFFKEAIPPAKYTIWTYDVKTDTLTNIGEFN